MTELSWEQVAAWRMDAQGLVVRAAESDWLSVVERVCGLHAQVMSSAELMLHARVEGLEPDAVASALWESRALVKTWAMRGTLHLLPSEEYRLWQAALGQFEHYRRAGWLRGWKITAEEMEQLIDTVGAALDGEPLTREQLADEVVRVSGSAHLGELVRGSWGSMLKPAAYEGRLCFGPSVGQKVTFTRPDAWLSMPATPARPGLGTAGDHAALPRGQRPRHPRGLRALVGRDAGSGGPPDRGSGRRGRGGVGRR